MKPVQMFYKPTGEYLTVFDIRYDQHAFPHFLVRLKGQWRLISAKHFQPEHDPMILEGGEQE